MLLSTAIERYVLDLEERMLSEAHIETVTYRLERVLDWLGDALLGDITRLNIARYFRHEEGRGLAEGSLAGFRSTQNAFWRFCDERSWVEGNLASRVKRYSSRPRVRKPAPEDDIQTVAEKLPAYADRRDGLPVDVRNALMVSLSIDSGARLGALYNLTVQAVQDALANPLQTDAGQTAYVAESTGKAGPTNVVFFDDSARLYDQWRERQARKAKYVFTSVRTGKRLDSDSLGRIFGKVCKWCGVDAFSPQAVRKANVTGVIRLSDLAVGQQYAGHSDMAITREHYYNPSREQVIDTAAELATQRRQDAPDNEMARFFGVRR